MSCAMASTCTRTIQAKRWISTEPWSATRINLRVATTAIRSASPRGIQVRFQTTAAWLLAVNSHLIQVPTTSVLRERPPDWHSRHTWLRWISNSTRVEIRLGSPFTEAGRSHRYAYLELHIYLLVQQQGPDTACRLQSISHRFCQWRACRSFYE